MSKSEGSPIMIITAQISIYPLRQERLSPGVEAVAASLAARGLQSEVGPMSTVATGEIAAVLDALRAAFEAAAATGHVVMAVTLSNACPVPEGFAGRDGRG
jgi:uncharacterized protein YqgV (UPF0045/DUF77 family)